MSSMSDELETGAQPSCPHCVTVTRDVDGGYECGGCGWFQDVPWVERPRGSDELPAIG